MTATMNRPPMGQGLPDRQQFTDGARTPEPERHREGPIARQIEEYTAQLPSDTFLWAAGASVLASVVLMAAGKKDGANFVSHWAPTFLMLGLYNKIVKVAGTDRSAQTERA